MEKLKTYYLEINENDETGVDFVAFVDKPAIEVNWKAFNSEFGTNPSSGETQEEYLNRCIPDEINAGHEKDQAVAICYSKWENRNFTKQGFKTVDQERRIVSGALMLADTPIYRRDDIYGEYQVVFTPDTIEKIVNKFFKNGNQANVNGMHNQNFVIDGVYMFESFIIDKSRGIKAPKGFENIPEGSWFGSFKVDNEQIWNDYVKSGVFKGFSVEGMFNQSLTPTEDFSEVMQALKEFAKSLDLNTLD